jgi:hypothetical protein
MERKYIYCISAGWKRVPGRWSQLPSEKIRCFFRLGLSYSVHPPLQSYCRCSPKENMTDWAPSRLLTNTSQYTGFRLNCTDTTYLAKSAVFPRLGLTTLGALCKSAAETNSSEAALLLILSTMILVAASQGKKLLDLCALHTEAALKESTGQSGKLEYFKAAIHGLLHHNPSNPTQLHSILNRVVDKVRIVDTCLLPRF